VKAIALQPEEVTAEIVEGRVLAQDIVSAGATGRVRLGKGRILDREDADALRAYSGEIHLVQLDPGDVHEDEASLRLARAIAGDGVELRGPVESQTQLRSTRRGLLKVKPEVLQEMNCLPDISVFTSYDGQPVDSGRAIGAAKVTPLAVPGEVLERAEAIAGEAAPVITVCPFLGGPVGVVVRERIAGTARERFESAIHLKIGWFGSRIAGIRYLPESVDAIGDAIESFITDGAVLVLAAGVNSTDPLDLTIQALERIGARTERRGVPAHPGSTCWLAYVGNVPVFGLALCGMFSRTTALDLLLPRFLSGGRVRAEDIAAFGHGGLLSKEMAFRFPNYEGTEA
jgi:hypothetical protein